MDRSELHMLDVYKREDMQVKLKPITNWDEIKKGTEIYHCDSNDVYSCDIFQGINSTDDCVVYINQDNKQYSMSKSGWYLYDEYIADEVKEKWTPKLWIVSGTGQYKEDYGFYVACNEQHLLECWNEENKEELTFEEFTEEYDISLLNKCGDFDIEVK